MVTPPESSIQGQIGLCENESKRTGNPAIIMFQIKRQKNIVVYGELRKVQKIEDEWFLHSIGEF